MIGRVGLLRVNPIQYVYLSVASSDRDSTIGKNGESTSFNDSVFRDGDVDDRIVFAFPFLGPPAFPDILREERTRQNPASHPYGQSNYPREPTAITGGPAFTF